MVFAIHLHDFFFTRLFFLEKQQPCRPKFELYILIWTYGYFMFYIIYTLSPSLSTEEIGHQPSTRYDPQWPDTDPEMSFPTKTNVLFYL